MNLGDKRNLLASYFNCDIIVHIDTDDFYLPTYISHSEDMIVKSKRDVAGTADMFIYFSKEKKKRELINYLYSKCNEATYWEENKFGNSL